MVFKQRRRPELHIDVINMVDVFLTLLIFFMLSTTFIMSPGIKVTLPKSSVDAIPSEENNVRIWIPITGSLYVNKKPVDDAELRAQLARIYRENSQALVVIEADEAVTHGKVVEVMDMVRNAGLTRVAIATQPSTEKVSPREGAAPSTPPRTGGK